MQYEVLGLLFTEQLIFEYKMSVYIGVLYMYWKAIN